MGPNDVTDVNEATDTEKVTNTDEVTLDELCSLILVNDPDVLPNRYRREPPWVGAYTEDEYKEWVQKHPKAEFYWGNRSSKNQPFTRRPKWFWDRCYFYAGRTYGGSKGAIMEIWLSNKGDGLEYRVFQEPKRDVPPEELPEFLEEEVESSEYLRKWESAALEEAQVYADDYADTKDEFTSRSSDLKDVQQSPDYDEDYRLLKIDVNEFQDKFNWIIETRIPELEDKIVSQDGARKMAELTNKLDLADFKKWKGEDIVDLFRDLRAPSE